MSRVFVFGSQQAEFRQVAGGVLRFSYSLPRELEFDEPQVVRQLWITPAPQANVAVLADFVEPQHVLGKSQRLLATSIKHQLTAWLPLSGNRLPATGLITIARLSGAALPQNSEFKLAIEVASVRCVNLTNDGATGQG